MPLIAKLTERLKRHPKRVVFPEGGDPRILQAARKFATRELGIPILLGDRARIKSNAEKLDISLDRIRVLEPRRSDEWNSFVAKFQGLRRFKNLKDKDVDEYLENTNYFATMMLAMSQADAIVSGATSAASSALRPLLQIIPLQDEISTASSLNIFDLEDPETGKDRELFLADCAVLPDPTAEQLRDITVTTAALNYHLTNTPPKVALLSYTSKSVTSKNATVAKMKAATELARKKARELGIPMEIDGELQVVQAKRCRFRYHQDEIRPFHRIDGRAGGTGRCVDNDQIPRPGMAADVPNQGGAHCLTDTHAALDEKDTVTVATVDDA